MCTLFAIIICFIRFYFVLYSFYMLHILGIVYYIDFNITAYNIIYYNKYIYIYIYMYIAYYIYMCIYIYILIIHIYVYIYIYCTYIYIYIHIICM